MKNIIIATGRSGGHIFPAASLAKEIKSTNKEFNIVFISTEGELENRILLGSNFQIVKLDIERLSFSLSFFRSILKLMKSFLKSHQILQEFNPMVVVGFGGYVSIPVLCVAFLRNIPIIIHEQNLEFGKANRLLSFIAKKVAISFTETKDIIKNPFIRKKVVLSGNPVRDSFYLLDKGECFKRFGFDKDRLSLLILGGSQGSLSINNLVKLATSKLPKHLIEKIQIIHIFGKNNKESLEAHYKNIDVNFILFNFFRDMPLAYKVADLVISRAGATTIAELSAYGIPAVLVPYPYAGRHQLKNAKALVNKAAAFLVEENNDASEKIYDIIKRLLEDRTVLEDMKKNLLTFNYHKEASSNLAKEVIALC